LKTVGALADVDKCKASKKIRAGKGKMRNRRYTLRRGPLVIYDQKSPMVKAFRNLPGVDLCSVDRLNLLKLAPGGHVGRFVIWTESAFKKLDALYGTYRKSATLKVDYHLPRAVMTNASLARIINSDEIQSKVRPAHRQTRNFIKKKNPLVNRGAMIKLNPFSAVQKKRAAKSALNAIAKRKNLHKLKKEGKNTASVKRADLAKSRRSSARSEAVSIIEQLKVQQREEAKYAAAVQKAVSDGTDPSKVLKKDIVPVKTPTMGRTNFYMRMFY